MDALGVRRREPGAVRAAQLMISGIESALRGRTAQRAQEGTFDTQAAVSLMLRPAGRGLEFLAIRRSENERDPWSGHMALPGGRKDPADESLWATAVRETLEEVGIDLGSDARLLGQLDDVNPSIRLIPSIAITPFVVAVDAGLVAMRSAEVERTVWVPLAALIDESFRGKLLVEALPGREHATIEYEGYVIWGLTLMVLSQLEPILRRIGYPEAAG